MTQLSTVWPTPHRHHRSGLRRLILSLMVIAVLVLAAAAALVHLNDVSTSQASTAQLVREGGPLYPVSCSTCDTTAGSALLTWVTDARTVTVWALAAFAAAATTVAVRLSATSKGSRASVR